LDARGSSITDYELQIDGGTLISSFTTMSYDYSVDGFTYTVDRASNFLTTGSLYRFQYRAKNAIGYSDYSDTVRFGMGPLPSTMA
jgi:hypothetical protein